MKSPLSESVRNAWSTNNRVTIYLVENLPPKLWTEAIPGAPRRTVRSIAAHLHNVRCRWIKTLGAEHGIASPAFVDRYTVRPKALVLPLKRSGRGIAALLQLGADHGGRIPPSAAYTWRNLPLDVGHVLSYFVAHEAHHRGQIVMVARELGHRLPADIADGLWQWNRRAAEAARR